jgi:DNA-binding NarL/FixJ family response regulator
MEVIRVLITDDHTLFRAGLHALLNLFSDIQVVGEASTGEEAITKAEALQPDIVLMDLQMPGINAWREWIVAPHYDTIQISDYRRDNVRRR